MSAYLVDRRTRCDRLCGRYAAHAVLTVDGKHLGEYCWSCATEIVAALSNRMIQESPMGA